MYEEVSVYSYITRNKLEKSITILVKFDEIYVGFFTIDSDNDLFITYEENSEYDKELVVDVIKSHILNDIIYDYSKYISVKKTSYINICPDAYRNLRSFIKDYDIKSSSWGEYDVSSLHFTCIYFAN